MIPRGELPGGRILSVGIVHTDFSTAGLRGGDEVRRAVAAHLAWHEGRVEDPDWLRTLHSIHRAGLSWPGGWSVATHHSFHWTRLGKSVNSVAYVNAKRCQWPGAGPPERIVDDCVTNCSLFTLVNTIKSRLVISKSRPAFERLRASVPTLYVHQLNGRNLIAVELAAGSDSVTIRPGRSACDGAAAGGARHAARRLKASQPERCGAVAGTSTAGHYGRASLTLLRFASAPGGGDEEGYLLAGDARGGDPGRRRPQVAARPVDGDGSRRTVKDAALAPLARSPGRPAME